MAPEQASANPLDTLHGELGARVTSYRGVPSPAAFGSVEDEYGALTTGAALVTLSGDASLEMVGEDRIRFLNGLVTCAVQDLEPGQGTYGFIAQIKGRILADLRLLALEDRLLLGLPPGRGEAMMEHLSKYKLADRVEIRAAESAVELFLTGPGVGDVLSETDLPVEAWSHVSLTLAGTRCLLIRQPSLAEVPCCALRIPLEGAEAVARELLGQGFTPVGTEAFDTLRVEAGYPLWGVDYDDGNFPKETGLEEAVSYTKGCYLGQEVIARIHYRGGVNRHLRGLWLPADARSDSELSSEGRAVGRLTSAVDSLRLGRRIGLAILHRRAAEPGQTVELTDGAQAEVAALPFSA